MAEWIRNGYECSECGFRLPCSAECYEWIERGDHGYLFKNYAVIPSECPRCHSEMIAVVCEEIDCEATKDLTFSIAEFYNADDEDEIAYHAW